MIFKLLTMLRLVQLVGARRIGKVWNSNTVQESYDGKASPLETAAYLTLQNIPNLGKRAGVDRKLRKHIKNGNIRRGVLTNGYPDPMPQQTALFDPTNKDEAATPPEVTPQDMASLIEEVDHHGSDYSPHLDQDDDDYDDEEYDNRSPFLWGLVTGALLTAVLPAWMLLKPQYEQLPLAQKDRYSPQVVKVAAAQGRDCTRSQDLYSQLFCGDLWRKELNTRVEQLYTDLLAVSTAVDELHRQTGFDVPQPLAERVQTTHMIWQDHMEKSCNTTAAVDNLGAQQSSRYIHCIHTALLRREAEIRDQLNYLRGLGWHEQADDALNNELIAIRNMRSNQPNSTNQQELPLTDDGAKLGPELTDKSNAKENTNTAPEASINNE